jgi:alpha-glucosidase (family GH31 glycosyl hydrolase)
MTKFHIPFFRHLLWGLLLLLVPLGDGVAQQAPVGPGAYVEHRVDESTVVVEGESAELHLTLVRPSMVKVHWRRNDSAPDTSRAVVVDPSGDLRPTVQESAEALYVRGGEVTAIVDKEPLRVRVANEAGQTVFKEDTSNVAWTDTSRTLQVHMNAETRAYGTGERPVFGVRGHAFDLFNTQRYGYSEAPMTMKVNVPFVPTTGGYGLFVDNPYRAQFDVASTDSTRLAYRAEGGQLRYYVLVAPTVKEQLRQYTALTGRQPLPPKWALGYMQSKYGYRTEAAARGVVDTLRNRNFPIDALILDLYWFEHMGDLRWNREAFPEPHRMMEDLQERGVQTLAITEPYITRPSRLFGPALDSNFVGQTPDGEPYVMEDWWSCPNECDVALLDITDPAARDWWASQHPPFMGETMAGLWTDLGEPEEHPDDMQHHTGPAPAVHNLYNLLWSRTLYRRWDEWRPNQRIVNLTRSGYAGSQRFGTVLWSGDVARTFEGLQAQPPLLLNMGLSGFGYYGSDLGGFTGDTKQPELYTRWLQHGALSPIMRVHGVDNLPTEPWRFGTQVERVVRSAVQLRYRLMPYLYSLAWTNHRTGLPLARPLFFADPNDEQLHGYTDAYLLGPNLLVAPVLEEGKRSKTVRLPEGTWVDWWTDRAYDGGQTVTVDAPLDQIPLFVQAGSIVPTRPVAPHTGAQPADTLGLTIHPDTTREASFSLYEDDGTSRAYEEGAYAVTSLRQSWEQGAEPSTLAVTIGGATGHYEGQPDERTIEVAVHRFGDAPRRVTADGQQVRRRSSVEAVERQGGWTFDADEEVLHIQRRTDTHTPLTIRAHGVEEPTGP